MTAIKRRYFTPTLTPVKEIEHETQAGYSHSLSTSDVSTQN